MLGPLTTKLGTLMYCDKFHQNRKYKLQAQTTKLVIVVYVYNFTMLCPFVTKLGTLTYFDKVSSKQKIHVCKQQQTASGNEML